MELNLGNSGAVVIGGVVYSGNKIEIKNNKIIIDGEAVNSVEKMPNIEVSVYGDVQTLNLDSGIVRARNVDIVNTQSGDVAVGGNVGTLVSTLTGDVICQKVLGPVTTVSGDIIQGQGILQKQG